MKRVTIAITLLAIGALILAGNFSIVGTAAAQKTGSKVSGRLPDYWKQLGLSKDQILKAYTVQKEYRIKIGALEKQIAALEQEQKTTLVEILTESQKEKLRHIYLKKAGLDPIPGKASSNKDK